MSSFCIVSDSYILRMQYLIPWTHQKITHMYKTLLLIDQLVFLHHSQLLLWHRLGDHDDLTIFLPDIKMYHLKGLHQSFHHFLPFPLASMPFLLAYIVFLTHYTPLPTSLVFFMNIHIVHHLIPMLLYNQRAVKYSFWYTTSWKHYNWCIKSTPPPPWPFKSMTVYLLMEWMITGSNQKSFGEVDHLADVVTLPDFGINKLADFSTCSASHILYHSENHNRKGPYSGNTWQETHIDIGIPLGNKNTSGLSQIFSIPRLYYWPLLGVLNLALADVTSLHFHFSLFKKFWKKPCGHEECCFNELYTPNAWLNEHDWLQHQPNEPGCKFKKVILGLMLWFDSTHLANFSSASVWPLYLYFGNLFRASLGQELPITLLIFPQSVPVSVILLYHSIHSYLPTDSWLYTQCHLKW